MHAYMYIYKYKPTKAATALNMEGRERIAAACCCALCSWVMLCFAGDITTSPTTARECRPSN